VSTANGHSVRKTGSGFGIMVVPRGGATQTWLTIIFRSKGDSRRTSDDLTARTKYRPRRRLLRPATVKIMVLASPVMMAASIAVALSEQEPLPLPGIITPPNIPAARERTATAATADAYQHVLAVLAVTLVNEVTGKQRSGHHVEVRSSTDCRQKTARVNEMLRTGSMIELPVRMLV